MKSRGGWEVGRHLLEQVELHPAQSVMTWAIEEASLVL